MSEIATLAATIFKRAARSRRFVVALAGPPGAGKSTIAKALSGLFAEGSAVVVPMDGFHFDDIVLEARGLRARKGAPETFDFHGFEALLKRIRGNESEIAIPVFDRSIELSRAGAAIIDQDVKFILVEGNYLLLDEAPWDRLAPLFDFTVFVDASREELDRRLVQRWDGHGKTEAEARAWIESNDMPNIDRVLARRRKADLVILSKGEEGLT
jgi:pantothenate kinase